MSTTKKNENTGDEANDEGGAGAPGVGAPGVGAQYVTDYLPPEADRDCDTRWLAEWINNGRLIVCPHCRFLHLPTRPFPPDPVSVRQYGPPLGACDVCAEIAAACDPAYWGTGWEDLLAGAAAGLADARSARAGALYRLWIGATNGADALRVAALADGLTGLLARTAPAGKAAG